MEQTKPDCGCLLNGLRAHITNSWENLRVVIWKAREDFFLLIFGLNELQMGLGGFNYTQTSKFTISIILKKKFFFLIYNQTRKFKNDGNVNPIICKILCI